MELKEKEAFFALYWNQFVGRKFDINQGKFLIDSYNIRYISYLELKSLEDITEIDAIAIGFSISVPFKKLKFHFDHNLEWTVTHIGKKIEGSLFPKHLDILRQRGYATPWTNSEGRTYTISELVAEGVVKFKTKNR